MQKNKITLLILTYFISHSFLLAQTSFDLWTVQVQGKGARIQLIPGTEKALTDREEYDNQPSFINESQVVFSAADKKGNHDIIVYNFENGKFTNLSKTADRSEFSPTITDCGQYISAVVVEPDGKQRLWLYPTNFEEPELLYDDIEPVGYYDWYDNKAAMFVLGDPNSLIYARGRNDLLTIDQNVGRSIHKRPKTEQITYFDQDTALEFPDGEAYELKSFDFVKDQTLTFGLGLPGSQDFIWLDKNTLLMARGNSFYLRKWNEKNWKLLGSISADTHQNISRIAYSPDQQVLVFAMERK
ncbi:TolB family protein [Algoriphagus hitonicola]|uniref:WD40-like Beta Propeller Repeat n=1 Tax=Algoriphagus hitonicola TaxID=435880 RepID=A0A1I2RB99_9BACT|nr:hypothetical protein [Algoriphagus hitonicola]SFG38005.1 hypothetical protein SAMN04487988_103177 [Algoriphagus hitonicola]